MQELCQKIHVGIINIRMHKYHHWNALLKGMMKQKCFLMILHTTLLLPGSMSMVTLLKFLANGITCSPTLCPCSSPDRSKYGTNLIIIELNKRLTTFIFTQSWYIWTILMFFLKNYSSFLLNISDISCARLQPIMFPQILVTPLSAFQLSKQYTNYFSMS